MSRQIINDTYALQIPDSFEMISPEELQEMSRNGGDPFQWGVRDKEKHIMILAMWKKYPAILSWMADLKAIAKRNQELAAKGYAGHGYRFLDYLSWQAGEEKAEGYRFTYNVGNISQAVSSMLVKNGKIIYAFTCVGHEENTEGDLAAFRDIMESLEYV